MADVVISTFFLIGFRNRIYVLLEWMWAYFTRERSARLITGDADELRDAVLFMEGATAAPILDGLSRKEQSEKVAAKGNT